MEPSSVQKKISCVFETAVVEESSAKRSNQSYKVVATDKLKVKALQAGLDQAIVSEKVDGTCCYIAEFQGKPHLWARLDRKPNKISEKKFKKYQNAHRAWELGRNDEGDKEPTFTWSVKDFKDVPADWKPASGVEVVDGVPQPDDLGHTPGWVPVDPKSRQHCWHLQSVNLVHGLALVLRRQEGADGGELEIAMVRLKDYIDRTMELIGTNINGNPYSIGCKEKPIHILVPHGEILFESNPPLSFAELGSWFDKEREGQVEGIVWHCPSGEMFKFHRHHLGLKWPVNNLKLASVPVKVNIDSSKVDYSLEDGSLFKTLGELNGKMFSSITDILY